MSNSNLLKFKLCLFPTSIFWLCLIPNSLYYHPSICYLTEFIMLISKGLIPNSMLCLIPKVLLQCPVSVHFMSNSKGLPTLIRNMATKTCQILIWKFKPHSSMGGSENVFNFWLDKSKSQLHDKLSILLVLIEEWKSKLCQELLHMWWK